MEEGEIGGLGANGAAEEAVVSSRERSGGRRRSAAVAVDTLGERERRRDKTNDYICRCRKWIAWQQLDRID